MSAIWSEDKPDILVLLRLIEETVPVQRIWLDTAEDKETPTTGFAGAPDSEVTEMLSSTFEALVKFRGLSPAEARERLSRTPHSTGISIWFQTLK
ncbi:MAG TPA: hypothetical protein VFJ13_08105 [Paracoccaceae bacterium]|nr:hypothetical protein [Paracoccaceae bacterium]